MPHELLKYMKREMNVSDLEECKSATVYRILVSKVSPIKKSHNKADVQYFESNFSVLWGQFYIKEHKKYSTRASLQVF